MNKSVKLRAVIASFVMLFFVLASMLALKATNAKAATTSITVEKIDYEKSIITLKGNANDSKIYFSDSKGKSWETISGTLTNEKTISMDISWIPVSSNYTIKFKGDSSKDVVTIVIPKQLNTFKARYNSAKQSVTYTNQGTRTVQWRKKDSYIWYNVNETAFTNELDKLSSQGATLYLRLAPINGSIVNGELNIGQRPSKEVTITIPKKANAPEIKIDGSKFLIPVKKNSGYRVVFSDGTTSEWTTVSSATDLMLSKIAGSALYINSTTKQNEVILQFRTNATSSAQASRITTITVPVQAAPPSETTYGISLDYTSSKSLELAVRAASSTQPFEYTIVEPGDTFNYQEAVWTSITSSAQITITESKAKEGSHIYVRKKSIAADDKVAFALASKELDITGSSGVNYPDSASAKSLTTLVTTAGVVKEEDSSSYLTFTISSPTKTTVSSIKFKDIYGNVKGTITNLKSTVVVSKDNPDEYIITTKITSTESIDHILEQALYGTIVLANSDEVESTTTSGLLLYIYPKTIVNNKDYKFATDSFERVYSSKDTDNDDSSFQFNLDFGKNYVYDKTDIDKFTSEKVTIKGMTYDSYELNMDNGDYSVVYGTRLNDKHEAVRTALVTVNVNKFETDSIITKRNAAVPLIINLSNGEKLENAVTINLIETATIVSAPIAYSITEGSLEETKTETITNPDNTTTTVTKEVVTFSIKLNIFSPTYEVGVSDVTWDGISIMKSAEISNGVATIDLSNSKIKKLTTDSTTTKNIVITLSNGYVIKNGCKLTIIDKD